MDSTEYRIPVVLSEDGLSHIPLQQGQKLAVWSVPGGTGGSGDSIGLSDIVSREPNNPIILDAAGKIKLDMSRLVNPSDSVLFLENNLLNTQVGIELDNSTLVLTGVNNTPIATVELPIVPGFPTVAEFLFDYTPPADASVAGGTGKGTYLHMRFAMSNGESKDIYVNFSSLDVADYKVSDGLTLDRHVIGMKLAPNSGLSLSSQGLSVSEAYTGGDGIDITPQRSISVRAGTGLTFNSGELQALPYTAGTAINITNRVVGVVLADDGGLMVADGKLALKLAADGYLVSAINGIGVSPELLELIESAGDDALARANEAYELASGLESQITGAYEAAESAASSAELAQTQAATAIEAANNKVDRSGDTMTGALYIEKEDSNGHAISSLDLFPNQLRFHGGNVGDSLYYHLAPEKLNNKDNSSVLSLGADLTDYDYSEQKFLHKYLGIEIFIRASLRETGGTVIPDINNTEHYLAYRSAPDIPDSDNSQKIPDTAWVNQRIQTLAGPPEGYDELKETVNNLPALIDANAQSISDINNRLDNLDIPEVDLSGIEAELANKADKTTVQTLQTNLNNKVDKSGDTMSGYLKFSETNTAKGIRYEPVDFAGSLYEDIIFVENSDSSKYWGHLALMVRQATHTIGWVADYGSTWLSSVIHLGVRSTQTGSVSTTVLTPISDSNDDSIANTEWVNQRLNTFDTTLGLTTAKSNGFFGILNKLGGMSDVDANTIITPGNYLIHGSSTEGWAENNWPRNGQYFNWLSVRTNGSVIIQYLRYPSHSWIRMSANGGESYTQWNPLGGSISSLTFYISKSGNDNNTGFSSSYPISSFARAFQIADVLAGGAGSAAVTFRVGAGEWGDLLVNKKPYTLIITPYDGQLPTAASSSLPIFTSINSNGARLQIGGLLIYGYLSAHYHGYILVDRGYKRIWRVLAREGGIIYFASDTADTNLLEMGGGTPTTLGFQSLIGGIIYLNQIKIRLISNCTADYFLDLQYNGTLIVSTFTTSILTSSATFTGRKYIIGAGSHLSTTENTIGIPAWLSTVPGTQAGVDYPGSVYNGIPKGLIASAASASMLGLPEAIIPEVIDGDVQTLDNVKTDYIGRLKQEATRGICGGFPYEINGENYHISYDLLDQINLNDNATIAIGDSDSRFDVSVTDNNGESLILRVSSRVIQDIHKYAVISHKNPILADMRSRINRIMLADSEEKIKEIYMDA
ncbi:MAG: hypothetical protein HDQ88_12005 [Clostridia bacterium]|nr:hypothetical protein [Clostridia bacterium]